MFPLKKMSEIYWSNLMGSGVANVALVLVVGLVIWIKRRIKLSKCKTNCHWFECESALTELGPEVRTQRGMLQQVLDLVRPPRSPTPGPPMLELPGRVRATSV